MANNAISIVTVNAVINLNAVEPAQFFTIQQMLSFAGVSMPEITGNEMTITLSPAQYDVLFDMLSASVPSTPIKTPLKPSTPAVKEVAPVETPAAPKPEKVKRAATPKSERVESSNVPVSDDVKKAAKKAYDQAWRKAKAAGMSSEECKAAGRAAAEAIRNNAPEQPKETPKEEVKNETVEQPVQIKKADAIDLIKGVMNFEKVTCIDLFKKNIKATIGKADVRVESVTLVKDELTINVENVKTKESKSYNATSVFFSTAFITEVLAAVNEFKPEPTPEPTKPSAPAKDEKKEDKKDNKKPSGLTSEKFEVIKDIIALVKIEKGSVSKTVVTDFTVCGVKFVAITATKDELTFKIDNGSIQKSVNAKDNRFSVALMVKVREAFRSYLKNIKK